MASVINEVKNAPETFTSWDKCMDKAYCKWPAIIGIVVGSLILLSVLFCLVQCLCCGYSCAKMLCCCCNGCDCGGKDRRRQKDDRQARYKDNDYHQLHQPNPYSGYQPPPTMAPSYRGMPQTATFDDSKHADSLPAMPSWDNATTHRVEVPEAAPLRKNDDVEMGRLNPHTRGGYDQVPLAPASPTGAAPGYFAPQPTHPYQSDSSAQHVSPQPTGYNRGFEPAPIPSSPAPTYQSHAPHPSTGDRFMAGAAAPPSHHYQQPSPGYYPSNNTSYEPSYSDSYAPRSNTFSPPPAGSYSSFNRSPAFEPQQAHRETRPPSLLQVGRKAVPGSMREV